MTPPHFSATPTSVSHAFRRLCLRRSSGGRSRLSPASSVAALSSRARCAQMQVDADMIFDAYRQPPFRVVARGGLGLGDVVGGAANRLTVRTERFPLSMAEEFGSKTPVWVGRSMRAPPSADRTASRFTGRFVLVITRWKTRRAQRGDGSVAVGDSMRMDLNLRVCSHLG
jgi:hypothetical protein